MWKNLDKNFEKAANTSRMWSAYCIKTSEMAEVATFKRHQKYLKQFRFFIKKFELNGGDPFKVFFVKTRIGPFGPRPTNRLEVQLWPDSFPLKIITMVVCPKSMSCLTKFRIFFALHSVL